MEKLPHMISRGYKPLAIFQVNDSYILGVYQGRLSEFDLLLKFRQKDSSKKSGWSNIRAPKHIHWAVDLLLKMNTEPIKTKEFLNFLLDYWNNNVEPIKTKVERDDLLSNQLITEVNNEADNYLELANKGEYSVKFLILMAKLLMYQEKTNYPQAYMFKDLLTALENGKDIFKIVRIATHPKGLK